MLLVIVHDVFMLLTQFYNLSIATYTIASYVYSYNMCAIYLYMRNFSDLV